MENRAPRKFGWRDNLAYAAGDFGCNMSFALKSTLIIFWTQFMGMDSILYAGLLLLVQVWDAINDPLIGVIIDADRRKYRRGKFLAYVFAGSIGLIIGGALCFLPLRSAPGIAKNIIFVAGYVIWDAFYTVANVPYGSMLSLISDDEGDRASLSAWRSVGGITGQAITMALIPMLIYDGNQNIVGQRVFIAALIMGVIGFIAFQFMIRNTVIRVSGSVAVGDDAPRFNLLKGIKNFLRNRAAVGVTIAAMGMFLGSQGSTAAVTVLFQSYFRNVQISGIINMFSILPVILFTPFIRTLVKKYGKKELSVIGGVCSCAACALMLALPIRPDAGGVAVYAICQFVNSLGTGIFGVVCWSLMSDAIDYNMWKFGARDEGTMFSLHSFFRKLAQGFGPSLVLVIMVALGYVEANEGNQTLAVAANMRYLVAWLYMISAALQLLGVGAVYNLDRNTLKAMNAALRRNSY